MRITIKKIKWADIPVGHVVTCVEGYRYLKIDKTRGLGLTTNAVYEYTGWIIARHDPIKELILSAAKNQDCWDVGQVAIASTNRNHYLRLSDTKNIVLDGDDWFCYTVDRLKPYWIQTIYDIKEIKL